MTSLIIVDIMVYSFSTLSLVINVQYDANEAEWLLDVNYICPLVVSAINCIIIYKLYYQCVSYNN